MSELTIPVVVQTANYDEVPFTDWPVADLAKVFDLLKAWGLVDSEGQQQDLSSACGDFVVHEGRVVFRVSIADLE